MRFVKNEQKKLKAYSVIDAIEKLESKNKHIHTLVLGGSSFFPKGKTKNYILFVIKKLLTTIQNNRTLNTLCITAIDGNSPSSMELKGIFASELGIALRDHPTIERLIIDLWVPPEGHRPDETQEKCVIHYLQILRGTANISAITLKIDSTSDKFLEKLGALIYAKAHLESIHINVASQGERRIAVEILAPFLMELCQNKTLNELQLSGLPLGDKGLNFLIEQLEGTDSLKKFILNNNGIDAPLTAVGMKTLLDFLSLQEHFEELDISGNSLRFDSHQLLFNNLAKVRFVHKLSISCRSDELELFVCDLKKVSPTPISDLHIELTDFQRGHSLDAASMTKTTDLICDVITHSKITTLGLFFNATDAYFFDKLSRVLSAIERPLEEIILYGHVHKDQFQKIVEILDEHPRMQITCVKGSRDHCLEYGVIETINERNIRNKNPEPERKTGELSLNDSDDKDYSQGSLYRFMQPTEVSGSSQSFNKRKSPTTTELLESIDTVTP